MEKGKKIKIGVFIIVLLIGIFIINIFVSYRRIGNYSIATPVETFTFTEKIANKLMGGIFMTKDELGKQNFLFSEETIKKENENNIKKAREANKSSKIECNYSKVELENMYSNPENYIGKSIECICMIEHIGLNENQKQILINSLGEEEAKKMMKSFDETGLEAIYFSVKDTKVNIMIMCNKNEIEYDNWGKGTSFKIKGEIAQIQGDSYGTLISFSDNHNIEKLQ